MHCSGFPWTTTPNYLQLILNTLQCTIQSVLVPSIHYTLWQLLKEPYVPRQIQRCSWCSSLSEMYPSHPDLALRGATSIQLCWFHYWLIPKSATRHTHGLFVYDWWITLHVNLPHNEGLKQWRNTQTLTRVLDLEIRRQILEDPSLAQERSWNSSCNIILHIFYLVGWCSYNICISMAVQHTQIGSLANIWFF